MRREMRSLSSLIILSTCSALAQGMYFGLCELWPWIALHRDDTFTWPHLRHLRYFCPLFQKAALPGAFSLLLRGIVV
jgi:hypothetical protein